jgi:hypothetical protein
MITRSRSISDAGLWTILAASLLTACGQVGDPPAAGDASGPAAEAQSVPQSLAMGGAKSVTRFFVTSRGIGRGGDLGGLSGADAHCQALAQAEGSGDHTWRAYLSTAATATSPAVHARDRIGSGPWYNSAGTLIAATLDELHGPNSRINKETAVTERLDEVNGVGDTPNMHDILTGSRPDGTAFEGGEDLTCGNWTSSGTGSAQVGHHDRRGLAEGVNPWNSAHASRGCSQQDLEGTGGAGLFYCFAID